MKELLAAEIFIGLGVRSCFSAVVLYYSPLPLSPSLPPSRMYVLADVESVDVSFCNGLRYVLDNDPEPLDLTFCVQEQSFGDVSKHGCSERYVLVGVFMSM